MGFGFKRVIPNEVNMAVLFLRRIFLIIFSVFCILSSFLPAFSDENKKYGSEVNMWGRPGLIAGGSFERFDTGAWVLSSHFVFQSFPSGENISLLPFGVTYMASDNLVLYGNDSYKFYSAGQGLNLLVAGGKYGFKIGDPAWQFSLGCDVSTGPISNSLGSNSTDLIPEGTVSYVFSNGLMVNLELGSYFPGNGLPAYIRFTPGIAYPVTDDFTAIFELAGHHSQEGPVNPGSAVALGIRGKGPIHLQGFFGLGSSPGALSYFGGFSILMASSLFEGFI